ncbi:hypothetical protein ACFLUK_01855 [Chloroflexota bacterium]
MAVRQIKVLEPVADVSLGEHRVANLLDSLVDKTVSYHHSRGPYQAVMVFARKLGELLIARFGIREFVELKSVLAHGAFGYSDAELAEITKRLYDEFAQKVDCAVVGAAFCGGSTYWTMQASAEFQDRGIPTVSLVAAAYESLARFTCQARGYRELPMLILPNDFETKKVEEIHEVAEARVEEVLAKLATHVALV